MLFQKRMTMKKEIKHRHKWEQAAADCPFCGGGSYVECDCGEMKRLVFLKKGKYKLEDIN